MFPSLDLRYLKGSDLQYLGSSFKLGKKILRLRLRILTNVVNELLPKRNHIHLGKERLCNPPSKPSQFPQSPLFYKASLLN